MLCLREALPNLKLPVSLGFTEWTQTQLSCYSLFSVHSRDCMHLSHQGRVSNVRKVTHFNERNVIKANVGSLVPSGIQRLTDSCFCFWPRTRKAKCDQIPSCARESWPHLMPCYNSQQLWKALASVTREPTWLTDGEGKEGRSWTIGAFSIKCLDQQAALAADLLLRTHTGTHLSM